MKKGQDKVLGMLANYFANSEDPTIVDVFNKLTELTDKITEKNVQQEEVISDIKTELSSQDLRLLALEAWMNNGFQVKPDDNKEEISVALALQLHSQLNGNVDPTAVARQLYTEIHGNVDPTGDSDFGFTFLGKDQG